jgi:hypothetical protein
MKAKSNFSKLVVETVARGSLIVFGFLAVFIAGFVTWSFSGLAKALYDLF